MDKKVTLDEYLRSLQIADKDTDIAVDGFDFVIAYCGTGLTDEGREYFSRALALPMYVSERSGKVCPCVVSDNDEDYDGDNEDSALALACSLLAGMAGYCSCEDYDRWFTDN